MQKSFENSPPAARLLGRKLISYDQEREEAILEYEARPEFTNRHGTVQGGLLTAMLDSATAITLIAGLPDGFTAVTRRLDSSFLKPAPIGRLIVKTNVRDKSAKDAEVGAELSTPDGTVIASAVAYLRILQRS